MSPTNTASKSEKELEIPPQPDSADPRPQGDHRPFSPAFDHSASPIVSLEPLRQSRLEWLASLDPRTLSLVELVELYVEEMKGNPHTERQYNLRQQLERALWPERFENEPGPIGRPQVVAGRVAHRGPRANAANLPSGNLPTGATVRVKGNPKR